MKSKNEWHKAMYNKAFAEESIGSQRFIELAKKQVAFLIETTNLKQGDSVLDGGFMKLIFSIIVVLISLTTFAKDIERKPASIKSFDGFPLDAVIDVPQGSNKNDVKKVVVFVHGSGPQSLDEDLSSLTVPKGSSNLFFRDVADSFLKKNIATVPTDTLDKISKEVAEF